MIQRNRVNLNKQKKRGLDMIKIGMVKSDIKPRLLRFFKKFYETFLSFFFKRTN